jgi:hypothetical protein
MSTLSTFQQQFIANAVYLLAENSNILAYLLDDNTVPLEKELRKSLLDCPHDRIRDIAHEDFRISIVHSEFGTDDGDKIVVVLYFGGFDLHLKINGFYSSWTDETVKSVKIVKPVERIVFDYVEDEELSS